jgi:hypothetical protein
MSLEMDVAYPTRPVAGDATSVRIGAFARLRSALNVRHWPLVRQFMLALMILYVGKQIFLVIIAPPFSGHDEVAHYSYLRTVATDHRVPKLVNLDAFRQALANHEDLPGDYLPDELYKYCSYTLQWDYCHDPQWADNPVHAVVLSGKYYPSGFQYAANHPPLYYMLMTPIYLATKHLTPEGQQYWLRAASIPFGVMTVLLAYLLVSTMFPGDPFLRITVPAFVAFQTQISYEAAMLNNDILCIAIYSLILYLLVVGIRDRFPTRICVFTGAAFGLALLSKGTSMTAAPLIALAIIFGIGIRHVRAWVTAGAITGGIALALSWPWFLFLHRTYGDFSGLGWLEKLQYWNYLYQKKPSLLDQLRSKDFAVMRWRETWGEFGWRRIPIGDGILWAVGIFCLIALCGFIYYAWSVLIEFRVQRSHVPSSTRSQVYDWDWSNFLRTGIVVRKRQVQVQPDPVTRPERWQRWSILLLVASIVIAYYAVLQFGTRFSLTQARYYFPAINAIAVILMLGIRTLIPRSFDRYAAATIVAALLILNVVIYTQYVIPYWYLTT